MPLAWDPGQVHGPLARSAEDAAFMLDAMIGLSPISPISVAPPWTSALARVERVSDAKGLRIAYARDIAGIGVDPEMEQICRTAAERLAEDGAHVEEVAFDETHGELAEVGQIGGRPVQRQHLPPGGAELLDQIQAQEAGRAGHECRFGHGGPKCFAHPIFTCAPSNCMAARSP